ncbi:UDP-N-acetylglucosamine 2-epimerase [Thalassospira sp. GB04J01]|uniref:UDP-N-acetylglucosamine 2-epimerase n=1 Tax=Thalassospira sp. GB04J01 TaxID=1485225 RepID=UPI000C9BDE28|nr:UDP-N-acetylglucosamine 2-epimerase [Thalassospira sp. GB04J01]|tara:strand:+ start:109013 stop:110233 length:1221 start_codon:yes stop_codon:yes gene_type:complete
MSKKVIAVFTGNRAEYGLQLPVLKAIDQHPDLEYRLIVSGAHLDPNFGHTRKEIEGDGFIVSREVEIEMPADSLFATAIAIGSGVSEIAKALSELKPDMLVVYADRFEGFAAVIASTQMNIPTAHIEGGDLTEGGALDDSVRHAMTKLAHLHFTTNQQASNRVMAMGEESWRVHTVGFPAIDLIQNQNFAKPDEILNKLKLSADKPIVLFTQHSVTTEFDSSVTQLEPSLTALKALAQEGAQILVTYPNNDAGGRQIIERLNDWHKKSHRNVQLHSSLGRYLYHGVLALSRNPKFKVVCVGNSSSGIKETPAFGCPTVNVGSRQEGRLRGNNVIDTNYDATEIADAIKRCCYDTEFREIARSTFNPYWQGDAGLKIANILAEADIDQRLIRKKMTLRGDVKDGWYQ